MIDLNPAIMFEVPRRDVFRLAGAGGASLVVGTAANAEPSNGLNAAVVSDWVAWPSLDAARIDPGLNELRQTLYTLPTTSMVIVRGGKIAWTYGDITQVSYVASARKSILSILYGSQVSNGVIKLDWTLAELGIDDIDALRPIEKTATVRQILTATSGVYHPSNSPGDGGDRPVRGSVKPGSQFFYNNWDFNVAGAIYEKLTGRTVFQAFADDLAGPLGMEDFHPSRQHMLGYRPKLSRYDAYHFFLSGRDMARLGVLMLANGRWRSRQLIPATWVSESTSLHVPGAWTAPRGFGYGYYWWLPGEVRTAPGWKGAFAALGNYGQYLVCFPELDLVIVHRRAVTDDFAIARNRNETSASPAGGEVSLLPILDQIVAAVKA
jgi:CubicO group peptidase (beta-lactamase class C family)